ncbi:unnamed protein product [Parnassius mnemosyne]|uniref:Uncharacterized protein n=1 Tax=Parnassius mnemosyne TaxID=213953 RepID=A0AAV1KLJ8_9NEOP
MILSHLHPLTSCMSYHVVFTPSRAVLHLPYQFKASPSVIYLCTIYYWHFNKRVTNGELIMSLVIITQKTLIMGSDNILGYIISPVSTAYILSDLVSEPMFSLVYNNLVMAIQFFLLTTW